MRYHLVSSLALSGLACQLVNARQYGYNQAKTVKDTRKVAGAFPKLENVDLLAPAFQNPDSVPDEFSDGSIGPTSHSNLESYLQNLSDSNSWMTYHSADFQSEEGRSFPYVHLSQQESDSPDEGKVRVWLQGGVHGNEPSGDQSVLAFLGKMDADQKWAAGLLDKLEIFALPRYNPDGVFYFQRYLATNYDPNRDHIKLARQQTKEIKKMFAEFSPHIAIDMHEFGGTARYGANEQHAIAADALFSAAKNLNIDPKIRKMSEELFAKRMGKDQEAAGLRWDPYFTSETEGTDDIVFDEAGTDGKIGRNAMGLTQSITFLCETRGIGLADQHFERRTASAYHMILSIMEAAAENAEKVYNTIEDGIKRFKESKEDIIVTDYSEMTKKEYQIVKEDGSVIKLPVKFASTTPATANLTRSRPESYIIPPAWADLAARLRVHGLKVEELDADFDGPVEAYNVTSVAFSDSYYEGAVRAQVTTEVLEKDIKLPAGSFSVSTRQKNAAIAFVSLEPENIDSYASFNIIPLDEGDEYPIYRVVDKE